MAMMEQAERIIARTRAAWDPEAATVATMKQAPYACVYVVGNVVYGKTQARAAGREDIVVRHTSWLTNVKVLSCLRPVAMVLDPSVDQANHTIAAAIDYAKRRHIRVVLP